MSSPRETFNFGAAPCFTPAGRPDLLAGADMINFGSVPPTGSGQFAHRPPNGHVFRKRRSSPLSSGPARKRRADEESMIGGLQNLSLNTMREREQKSQFERWQELEAQLADQLAAEEEQHRQQQQQQPRFVLSDELQKIVSSPAPDLIPDTKSGSPCTALVVWRPPPVSLTEPEAAEDSAESPDQPTADRGRDAPPPPPAAYDFSPFRRPDGAQQQPTFAGGAAAPSQSGWPGQVTAPHQFGSPAPSPSGWPGQVTAPYQFGSPAPSQSGWPGQVTAPYQFGSPAPSLSGWPGQGTAPHQCGAAAPSPTGWPGQGTAPYQLAVAPAPAAVAVGSEPPTFAGCLGVPLPADDESMEL